MRKIDFAERKKEWVGSIDVARWEQFALGDSIPFQAMWYTVPPGDSCPRDQHPEPELSVVVRGRATVQTDAASTVVDQGSAFLLNSLEAHIVHNREDEPLVVFSAYWMPANGTRRDAAGGDGAGGEEVSRSHR